MRHKRRRRLRQQKKIGIVNGIRVSPESRHEETRLVAGMKKEFVTKVTTGALGPRPKAATTKARAVAETKKPAVRRAVKTTAI